MRRYLLLAPNSAGLRMTSISRCGRAGSVPNNVRSVRIAEHLVGKVAPNFTLKRVPRSKLLHSENFVD